MKKLIILAVALASANAFASRARVEALGNAAHLVDTETVYTNPADMALLGDYVNLENGSTNTDNCDDVATTPVPGKLNYEVCAQNSNASGQVVRSWAGSKFGLGIGHQSKNASTWGLRNPNYSGIASTNPILPGTTTIKNQQNPINLSWAKKFDDMIFGATGIYSNYNDKASGEKESSAGLRFGFRMGNWDAKAGVGLVNSFENNVVKYTGTAGYSLGLGYMFENTYVYGGGELGGFKVEAGGAEINKLDYNKYYVGMVRPVKKDGSQFFYGVSIAQENIKVSPATGDTKVGDLYAPFILGMEVDAASWLTLRGSVTQNVILNNHKTETPAGTAIEGAPGLNTTVAAVGAGLKFDKLTLDATLQGATGTTAANGKNDYLTHLGLTYMF